MQVITGISGSHCVVEITPGDNGTYIDAQKGRRLDDWGRSHPNGLTNIEVVRGGHVRYRETVPDSRAPERIIQLARRFA